MITYKNKNYICHLDLGMDMFRGKWKNVILCHLNEEPIRFLELQRRLPGVSQKVLNEQLKSLKKEGLIKKTIFLETPPHVEYSLTQKGLDLLPALKIIENWAKKYMND